jgi:prepilin-type N-terminal cleavage/methylation domain-containing protein
MCRSLGYTYIHAFVMIDTFLSRGAGLKSEGGFTLIELLVTMSLTAVVFGAIGTTLDVSQRTQARDDERVVSMEEARGGLTRMSREIRQASEIKTHEGGAIEFLARISGKEWKIKYNCAVEETGIAYKGYDECVRYAVEKSSGTLPTTGPAFVRNVLNPTKVFSYFKGATKVEEPKEMNVVTLTLELPLQGSLKQVDNSGYKGRMTLENAAFIRNCESGC